MYYLETLCKDLVEDMKWAADKHDMESIHPAGDLRLVLSHLLYYNILHVDTLCSRHWLQHFLETSILTVNLARTHQIHTVTKQSTLYKNISHKHKTTK